MSNENCICYLDTNLIVKGYQCFNCHLALYTKRKATLMTCTSNDCEDINGNSYHSEYICYDCFSRPKKYEYFFQKACKQHKHRFYIKRRDPSVVACFKHLEMTKEKI